MEPRIQYAKTKDGVSIAFWTLGKGKPLVHMPPIPLSHIEREWQMRELRRWYERLAEKRMLVRYDGRGFGLSQRDVSDYSLEALVGDLEAVVDHLGLERFDLCAYFHLGAIAVAYAARRPERLAHLILWCAFARGSDYYQSSQVQAITSLRDKDMEVYTEAVAHAFLGWSEGQRARRFAALLRESITREAMEAFLRSSSQFDVTSQLPQVKSPTLVLHRRRLAFMDVDLARGLASQIPEARLALLEGESGAPYLGDSEAVLTAIDEFLGEGEAAAPVAAPSGLVTIFFTDMEGSTTLTQRLGDTGARAVLRQHERIVREALKSHGGSEVKTTGDGFMASFSLATKALECAIAMQRAFAAHNESAEEPILVRVGLNAGEPIAEDEDLFGTAVIAAARIAAQAEGGQILVSNVVRELAAGKDFLFADRGQATLRGFDEPVQLYEVRWQDT